MRKLISVKFVIMHKDDDQTMLACRTIDFTNVRLLKKAIRTFSQATDGNKRFAAHGEFKYYFEKGRYKKEKLTLNELVTIYELSEKESLAI